MTKKIDKLELWATSSQWPRRRLRNGRVVDLKLPNTDNTPTQVLMNKKESIQILVEPEEI